MTFTTSKVNCGSYDLTVGAIPNNSKDQIKQPELAEKKCIPALNTSTIVIGKSGSGKSSVIYKLLNDPNMWDAKNTFDLVCLISPTAKMDDIQRQYPITDDDCIIDDLSEAPAFLRGLMDMQRHKIEEFGSANSPLVCVILDDCVADKRFINSKEFFEIFMKSRHYNMSVIIASQQYKSISKKARLQAMNVIWFASPMSETENLLMDHCPPNMTKRNFLRLIQFATKDRHSFLYINMQCPWAERYRRCFTEIISLANDKSCHGREAGTCRGKAFQSGETQNTPEP